MINLSPIKNTGGPAFPTEVVNTNDGYIHQGMTLRDYFAAKAMQAMLSDPDWRQDMSFAVTAATAYKQAAEMIAAKARYA